MIDLIAELALIRDSLGKRKLGITHAIAAEGDYLKSKSFSAEVIPDADLPKFGVTEIAAYYLLVQIVQAPTDRPIAEVLSQYETWTVLANKVLETYDKSLL
jgi:hypothetical protein